IVKVIDSPEAGLEDLMRLLPGPDFPTGGVVMGRRGIVEAYAGGRGRITLRGRVRQVKEGGRDALEIFEIPYQVVQSNLIEKIVDASREGRIPDVADVRNHSGRDAQTRILVVLKKGADPEVVEKQLYEFTPLQSTFSIINIALVNHQPRTLGLKQLIQCYVDHRKDVVRRRTAFLLRQAKQQAHRLEGLIYAVCDIDEVIRIIRESREREEAIQKLMDRGFRIAAGHRYERMIPERIVAATRRGDGARLTRVQAEAIGAMRLIQLVGLEVEKLASEFTKLLEDIEGFEAILADEKLVLDIVREDTVELKERFADTRRTSIEAGEAEAFEMADLIPEHEVVVTISHAGWVKRLPSDTYRTQGRGGVGIKGSDAKDGDFIEQLFTGSSHDDLLCFTNTGRVFRIKTWQIPEMARTAKGRAIQNIVELREGETVRAFLPVAGFETREDFLFFATRHGRVKRTALQDYRNVNKGGIIALNLNDGDDLVNVLLTSGKDQVMLATATGMAIRFDENDARVMGRAAAGVMGIDLAEGDTVVGAVRCDDTADLLTVTQNGYGKRTSQAEYLVRQEDGSTRCQSRGGKGRIDIKTEGRNGPVVAVRSVREGEEMMLMSRDGMIVRSKVTDVSRIGRNTMGVRVMQLREGDAVMAVAMVAEGDESAAPPPQG
ncbi:MAG: DNA gyrase C-terminal beta-propeller domain-containing protein, partial [Phycisphaerales bacterium]